MQISLFDIIAMVVNFFITLFLLQKFLYKPVMGIMEKRQAMVEATIRESETKMQEADELIETYRGRLEGIEDEERTMLDRARKEAQETKERLLTGYRADADERRDAYFAEVEEQKDSFETMLRRTLGTSSLSLARNILRNLTGDDLEEKSFDTLIQRIRELQERSDGIPVSGAPLILTSAKPVPDERRRKVEKTLRDTLGSAPDLRYEVDEDLVIGYALDFESYTLQANARKYLEESERAVMEQLRQKPN
jgi:F-type H+-transporting ATPase subunit b